MELKRLIFCILLVICLIFTITAISAANSDNEIINANNISGEVVSVDFENNDEKLESVENDDVLSEGEYDSFKTLETEVNYLNDGSTLKLENDYKWDSSYYYTDGIYITKSNIVIDGQGHNINGDYKSRLLYLAGSNIILKNINFLNGYYTFGGAIYCTGNNITILNCTFDDNRASYYQGGAIYGYGDDLKIINCSFKNNYAYSYGGAIYWYPDTYSAVINSTFENNQGGALAMRDVSGKSEVINCTFKNNNGNYGAIYIWGDYDVNKDNIAGCYFINNGIAVYNVQNSTVNLTDSVIMGDGLFSNNGRFIANNNWWGNTAENYTIKPINNDKITIDSWLFLDITNDFYKKVITASINNKYSENYGVGLYSNNVLPQFVLNITSVNSTLNDTKIKSKNGIGNVKYSLADDQDLITVSLNDFSFSKKIYSGSFEALKNLINSSTENIIKLETDYVYSDIDTMTDGIDIRLDHDLVIDGQGHTIDARGKSAIFNLFSNVTLKNINFANGNSSYQGAIYNAAKSIIINCTFENNVGKNGGGIWNQAYCDIIDCTFINNTATNYGGAVYAYAGSYSGDAGDIINCTFINNAAVSGGAIYSFSVIDVINSKFIGNDASSAGGAIVCERNNLNVGNCIFINNHALSSVIKVYSGNIYESIFLNNDCGANTILSMGSATANSNWFGNTYDTYSTKPSFYGITIDNWYFLNMTVDNVNAIADITLNNLYSETDGVSVVSNYNLPEISLDISAVNATADRNVIVIDKTAKASLNYFLENDVGSLTVGRGNVELTKEIRDEFVDDGSFKALQFLVNRALNNTVLELTRDYIYSDSDTIIDGILISVSKKNLTIIGNNHIIDAKGKSRIFLANAEGVTLKDIVLKNGIANKTNIGQAGAIQWDGDNGKIINCTFIDNVARSDTYNKGAAGAVLWIGNNGSIINSTFIDNDGDGHTYGGAVVWEGDYGNIANTKFLNNMHTNLGGALYVEGDYCNITNCTFDNNYANRFGGAIGLHHNNYIRISDCTFTNNFALYAGGAIYYYFYVSGENKADIINCTFINNTANGNLQVAEVAGGGAILSGKTGNIINCTFIGNRAPYYTGGAVSWYFNEVNITGCVFINNTANKYSAIDMDNGTVKYSIILSDDSTSVLAGANVNLSYNWWGNTADNKQTRPNGNVGVTNDIWYYLDIAPHNLDGYITISLNNLYNSTSNSVTAGSSLLPTITVRVNGKNISLAQDNVKLVNGKGTVKFNQIEYPASITVNFEDIEYTRVIDLGDFDKLQLLIDNAENNDVIKLTRNYTYNEFDSIKYGIYIDKNITIDGNGFTIDARGQSRIFDVDTSKVTFKNLNLVNGYSSYGSAIRFDDYYSTLKSIEFNVINCTFKNNYASYPDVWYGGGAIYISTDNGNFKIADSQFINNSAVDKAYGGAIYNGAQNGNFDVYNCSFTNNSATIGYAILIYSTNVTNTIDYSIFIGNVNDKNTGSAIYWANLGTGNQLLNNSILFDNGGSNLLMHDDNVVIDNNWWGNTADNYNVDPINNIYNSDDHSIEISSWLFLNATGNPTAISDSYTNIRFILQSYNSKTNTTADIDPSQIPKLKLSTESFLVNINGEVTGEAYIFEDLQYYVLLAGNAYVIGKNGSVSYKIGFKNKYNTIITVNDTVELYVDQNKYIPGEIIYDSNGVYRDRLSNFAQMNHMGVYYLKYESDNPDVVEISGDYIMPKAAGTARITVTYDESELYVGNSSTFTIIVKKIPTYLDVNQTEFTLNATQNAPIDINIFTDDEFSSFATPLVSDIVVEYSESGIAHVDPTSGIITALVAGDVTIKLIYPENDKFLNSTKTIHVKINKLPSNIIVHSDKNVQLYVGDTSDIDAVLNITDSLSDKTLTFSSSDDSIIMVDSDGKITALSNGTATVTISWDGNKIYEKSSQTVTVTSKRIPTTITVNDTFTINSTQTNVNLNAKLEPVNKSLNYESTNTNVVTVNDNGQITAVGGGFAEIIIRYNGDYQYENTTKRVKVTVNRLNTEITSDNPNILYIGDEVNVNAIINPNIGNLEYSSSDESVIKIDSNGLITAVANGTAVITIYSPETPKYHENSKTITVTVKKITPSIEAQDISLIVDETKNINAVLSPDVGELKYVSLDEDKVSVDGEGNVLAKAGGIHKINITFEGNDKYEAITKTISVIVSRLPNEVHNDQFNLTVGQTLDLKNIISNTEYNVIGFSMNTTGVIDIEDDTATALAGGLVNVTVRFVESDRYEEGQINIIVKVEKLPTDISIIPENIVLNVGDKSTITVDINSNNPNLKPDANDLIWNIINGTVIDIDKTTGEITALRNGSASISISFNEDDKYLSSSKTINVVVKKIQTSISIDKDSFNLFVGDYDYISSSLTPNGGNLVYSSSDDSIVVVDETGKITAKSKGTAIITVKFEGNDKYESTQRTVTVNVDKIPTEITANDTITIYSNETIDINAIVNVDGDYNLQYIVDNESVVTVDSNGLITAVGGGKTNVKIIFGETDKYYSSEKTVEVTVNKIPTEILLDNENIDLFIDEEFDIGSKLNPDVGTLIYQSNDSSVVSVDENGKLTAHKKGIAKITIEFIENGKYISSQRNVTVNVNKIKTSIIVNDTIILDPTSKNIDIEAWLNISDEYVLNYDINDSSVVALNNGLISAVSQGNATIKITFDGDNKYSSSNATVKVVVKKIETSIDVDKNITLVVGDTSEIIAGVNPDGGKVTYEVVNSSIVKVDENGIITALIGGKTEIIVRFAETEKYLSSNVTVSVTVSKKDIVADIPDSITLKVNEQFDLMDCIKTEGVGNNFIFSTNEPMIASVNSSGVITAVGNKLINDKYVGVTTVSFRFSENDYYNRYSGFITVRVERLTPVIDVNDLFTINVDDEVSLNVITDNDYTLNYWTNNSNIVYVSDDGVIRGVSYGTARISVYVTANEKYVYKLINITVNVNKSPSSISVEKEFALNVGDTINIGAILYPQNARGLKYISNDTSIVSVDSNGKITAIGKGMAKVTVKFDETNQYLSSSEDVIVTVNKIPTEINVENTTVTLYVDETFDLNAIIAPEAGVLAYVSDNPSVVSVDSNGKLTSHIGGNTSIFISFAENEKYLGSSKTVNVVVKKLPTTFDVEQNIALIVDDSHNIDAGLNHEGDLKYSSDNPSVVSVDSNGKLTAISPGSAIITISFAENDKYLANSTTVTVTASYDMIPTEITVNETFNLFVGDEINLEAILTPNAGKLIYSTDNPSVISIDENGNVKALSEGSSKITIKFNGFKAYLPSTETVTVNVKRIPTKIIVDSQTMELEVGQRGAIQASLSPDAGTLTYEFDRDDIISFIVGTDFISRNSGVVKVTISFAGDDKYESSSETVTITVNKVKTNIDLDNDEIKLNIGQETNIGAVLTPNAGKLIYASDNPNVISVDENGNVKALAEGNANITISFEGDYTYESVNAIVKVFSGKVETSINVKSNIDLKIGDETNINAQVNPDVGKLIYSSDNPSVVSVDENGNVKALAIGSATINVKLEESEEYSGSTANVVITVSKANTSPNEIVSADVAVDTGVATISVDVANDVAGNVSVKIGDKTYNVPIVNGKATLVVDNLASGDHTAVISYAGNDKYSGFNKTVSIHVPNIKIDKNKNINMIYYDGTRYVAHLTSDTKALEGKIITFKVNGKSYKVKTNKYGYAYFKITLTPNKYSISAEYLNVKVTNNVVVKSAMTAKNVKVKKSAKSLKIKVSLKKVNKKYLTGKKLTLKFNGKTYTAKTNKKGVATFTISKKVIKKLKAGKKYTYSVKYVKETVKKTVSVKK